jgi:hypothetical protein
MSYKTLIAAGTALALSPAIAFAAPAMAIVKTKPALTKQVKMEKVMMKKQHTVKKALVVHKPAKAKAVTKI